MSTSYNKYKLVIFSPKLLPYCLFSILNIGIMYSCHPFPSQYKSMDIFPHVPCILSMQLPTKHFPSELTIADRVI